MDTAATVRTLLATEGAHVTAWAWCDAQGARVENFDDRDHLRLTIAATAGEAVRTLRIPRGEVGQLDGLIPGGLL